MSRRALISGIGIAGPTLGWWLLKHGWEVTLVERAPGLRRGGYMIDFWGTGYEVAGRMGLLKSLHRRGYDLREVRIVDGHGKRAGGFAVDVMRRALDGRFLSILRSDLAGEIFGTLDGAELLFDDQIERMTDDGDGVDVLLMRGGARRFDMVIGADGLHSRVRELVFGPEKHFERYLGYCVAAFTTVHYAMHDADVSVAHGCPGREAFRFSLRDGRTVFFLIFEAAERPTLARGDAAAEKRMLHERYAGMGWEWPGIAKALDDCDDLYFDTVTQIRMDRWHRGRVALVGDAAFCPSLLAGEGASLAMAAAYVLAAQLERGEASLEPAFERYEHLLASMMRAKQDSARKFAKWFAPRTRVGLAVRNFASRALSLPVVGVAMTRGMLNDTLDLSASSMRAPAAF